jgi:poly(3-hydroxybutyrate) depolymerase
MVERNTPRDDERSDGIPLSRREFGKATGSAMVLAGMAGPAVAEHDGDRVSDLTNAMAFTPPIDEAFTPPTWQTIGPFQYQRRDTEIGWLFPDGGEGAFASGDATPGEGESLPSAFAGGSSVEWHVVEASDGTVSFPQVREEIDPTGGDLMGLFGGGGLFDDFQDWFGVGGIIYGMGYAYTTFEMDSPRRAVLESNATVWLNGQRYAEPPCGVVLREGTNYLLAKQILTLGQFGSVSLSFRPPEAPVEVNDLASFRGTPQNVVVPDLKVGEDDTDLPASVRVTNTTAREIDSATLTFAPDSDVLVEQEVEVDPPLAPFETRRVNTQVQLPGAADASTDGTEDGESKGSPSERAAARAKQRTSSSELPEQALAHSDLGRALAGGNTETEFATATNAETVTVELAESVISVAARVDVNGASHSRDVPIRVRAADEDRRQSTFVSRHDESVQTFAYRVPANVDSGPGPWKLVVSLHGANVPPINQAGANNSRKDTYVVAPAARGPVNYDHEDLGRLDDLEAMDVMADRFDIDAEHVYLSGHSMGGHGTWHVGLTHSDRFAAIGPSAGWTDHETYITTTWGRDKLHTYPRLKAVKETALQKNLAMPKTHNAADGNLPTFVLNGGQDTSVPVMQPRSYVRTLANRGLAVDGQVGDRYANPDPERVDVAYLEVPGAGHWWDKGIGPGNDGVNHPDMWTYLTANSNDPYPETLSFFTTNLRVEHEKHWVRVLEQERVHEPTHVDARVTADGIEMSTENVARVELDTEVLRRSSKNPSRRVAVNGRAAGLPAGSTAFVDLSNGLDVQSSPQSRPGVKGPDQYGPLVEVHHDPYRLVYGTGGSAAETSINRNLANVRSQRLVDRARAPAPVVPDTAVDRSTMESYNLVLFGQPSSNAVYQQVESAIPIRVGDGTVRIRDRTYAGDYGVELIYPNPHSEKLVQISTGTSLSGVRLTGARNWIPTQTASADYQVFDSSIRYQKWNACVAAGFFDKHWQVAPELGVLRDVDHST